LIIPKKDAVEPRGIRLSDHHATIIVVEDDPDLYAARLDDRYDVHVARGGEEALSVVNYPTLPLAFRLALEGGASCFHDALCRHRGVHRKRSLHRR
jgi:hypothetical protein